MYDNAMVRAEKAEAALDSMTTELGKMFLSAAERADRNVELRRRAEKAEASLHNLSLDLSTANHMIKLERDRADTLQTRLNEIDAMLNSPETF
jgi:predicted nuclease with TOPRIM domain